MAVYGIACDLLVARWRIAKRFGWCLSKPIATGLALRQEVGGIVLGKVRLQLGQSHAGTV